MDTTKYAVYVHKYQDLVSKTFCLVGKPHQIPFDSLKSVIAVPSSIILNHLLASSASTGISQQCTCTGTLASLSFPDKWGVYTSASFWGHVWGECEDSGHQLTFSQGLYKVKPLLMVPATQDTKPRSTQDILTCLLMWSIYRSVEQRAVQCFVSLMVPFNYLHRILWYLGWCNCLKI